MPNAKNYTCPRDIVVKKTETLRFWVFSFKRAQSHRVVNPIGRGSVMVSKGMQADIKMFFITFTNL